MGGQRVAPSSGSEAAKMGHRVITAELLSAAQLITTFFASIKTAMDKWILMNENILFCNLLQPF